MRALPTTRPDATSPRRLRSGLAGGLVVAGLLFAGTDNGLAQRRGPAFRPARQAHVANQERNTQSRPAEAFAGRAGASSAAAEFPGNRPAEAFAQGGARGFSGGQNGGNSQGSRADAGPLIRPNHPLKNQEHLGAWMNQHSNMPLEQQQRALAQEPGFRQLPPEQQQRMRDRLTQLNRMSPQQRQSVIARTEAMERLSPQQRQQVRSAAGELGSLPPERRRAVAQAFRGLQSMPADQRQSYMNSPQFRSQYTDGERDTLNHLMQVSPYLPMRQSGAPPQ